MATRAITQRSIQNMITRFGRSGVALGDGAWAAGILAAPTDRPSMHAAAVQVASRLAADGQPCTKETALEAAATLRGFRDWNALAARLPTAITRSSGDAAAVATHRRSGHTWDEVIAIGESARSIAPEGLTDTDWLVVRSSRSCVVTDTDIEARAAEIMRAVASGRLEGRGARYVGTVLAAVTTKLPATWPFDRPPLLLDKDPVVAPLLVQLAERCKCVDEAGSAIREAADAQARIAETHPGKTCRGDGPYGDYVAACVLMGGLRQANADVWRLDEEELREDRERRASRTSRQSASPGRSGGSSGSSSLRPA